MGRALSLINGAIIFGFSASLVLIPQAHWWFGVAALISSLLACVVIVGDRKSPFLWTSDDYKIVSALVFFSGVWWWNVLASGQLPLVPYGGYRHIYAWPLLAAAFLLALRVFTPSPNWLWLGVCCGASGAGLVAIYERVIVGAERADNGINAIPFGNLSLLMSALSLVAAIYFIQSLRRFSYGLTVFAICAAFLGFLASLLSGTRGGWVAIPFIFALLLPATADIIAPKTRNIGLCFIALLVVAIIAFPPSGVWLRLTAIFDNIYHYFISDEASTSLGIRFELWRAGWYMFKENPLMGVGEGGVKDWLGALVAEGVLYDRVIIYSQLHSDIIDTLARRGLIGVISQLWLYGAFASAFAKKALYANDNVSARLLAISGMVVIIAFFDFGLSQSMFRDLRGFSGFLGFGIILWGCLGNQPQSGAPNKSR
ncbi:O-antigen ligase family protein [Halovibrio sp. HP20-50]|uniref:O-antigen ligase family protein n=1 Tax=Halovibrio sp. HP20-59 TaxID=3080275 RepID=UPI00294B0562|nr:O-antigen ligase family protein [Halovibrio sp. HP20-59]MEA2120521.1 O-antigen ligase family protein [Halovibrio sp. HP20-59]